MITLARARSGDRGSVSVFVAIVFVAVLFVVAMIVDGGRSERLPLGARSDRQRRALGAERGDRDGHDGHRPHLL